MSSGCPTKILWAFFGDKMFNILLDKLPNEYEGYLIRPSFRIGMQICLCMDDPDYTDEEKAYICLNLLYGNGVPDIETAVKGLQWFMACGNPEHKTVGENKTLFYWDFDAARLFSSFKQTYGIDLHKVDLHWFEFIAMIGSLDKDSAFQKAVEIRGYDMKDLRGKHRTDMQNMKKNLTPEKKLSDEEQKQLDEFDLLLAGGDVNG